MTTPKPTLNLETVYIVTSDFYKHSVLITESEISTIRRHLSALALGLDEKFPYRDGDRLVDYQGDEFARIASPEELVYEVNLMLELPNSLITDVSDDLYAAPGTHDSTVIVGDGTTHIEGNAVDIINALWTLDAYDAPEAVWAALAKFPVTCDIEPEHTEPEHYEPSEAELEHWQDMCHEQYTGEQQRATPNAASPRSALTLQQQHVSAVSMPSLSSPPTSRWLRSGRTRQTALTEPTASVSARWRSGARHSAMRSTISSKTQSAWATPSTGLTVPAFTV